MAGLALFAGLGLIVSGVEACKIGDTDVSSLQSTDPTKYEWTDNFQPPVFKYQYTFCGQNDCGGTPGSLCQVSLNYPPQTVLMNWDDATPWTPTPAGYSASFTNGATCNGAPRVTNFEVECGDTNELLEVSEPTDGPCTYDVKLSIVCGGSLSFGSIFCIALAVSGVLYLALGCLYKRKKVGTSEMKESIPNVEFWSSLPGLVKDGVLFVFRDRCRSGAGGGGYDEI